RTTTTSPFACRRQSRTQRSKTWCRYTFASRGGDPPSLRRALLTRPPFPILQHAGLHPFLDETHDAPVRYPVLDEPHQPFAGDGVEVPTDVRVQHPIHPSLLDADVERIQRVMLVAARPESVGEAKEVLLIDAVQDRHEGALNHLVLERGDPQWSLSSV